MMRWRSLFVTGALVAAFALLVPAVAQAQTVAPTGLAVSETKWNSFKLEWTWAVGAGDAAEDFEVIYQEAATDADAFVTGATSVKKVSEDDAEQAEDDMYATTVSGLTAGKTYIVAVRGLDEDGERGTLSDILNHTADEDLMTLTAPMPERVSGVMVEAGDRTLEVSWSATYPTAGNEMGLTIKEYHLQYRTTQTADASAGDWTPEADGGMTIMGTSGDITNLMNGKSYDVRVRAENNAGGKGSYSRVTADSRGTPMAGDGTGDGAGDGDDMLAMPKISEVMAGDGQITVKWGMVDGATKYEARAVAGGNTMLMSTTEMSATFMNLTNEMEYMVSVRAGNADGYGEWSAAMAATPTMPMPTPALPVFGALALGAGLVAAGRARLRRRRALQAARVRGQFGR